MVTSALSDYTYVTFLESGSSIRKKCDCLKNIILLESQGDNQLWDSWMVILDLYIDYIYYVYIAGKILTITRSEVITFQDSKKIGSN